jgi:flagellar biosynthesis/type III secretory pathway M-ring protein FliF/YscJ
MTCLLANNMFENRTKKQRIIIYAIIAFAVTILLALLHYMFQGWMIEAVLIVAAIEYVCIFYILYLPLKYQKQ